MKRTLLAALVLLVAFTGSSCLIVDGSTSSPFDFNGVWSFAITGCQGQVAELTITQRDTNVVMVSQGPYETLVWTGSCDPWAGTISVLANEPWGAWSFQGRATGPDSFAGGYTYLEYRTGQCSGSFDARRVAYRAADAPAGPGLTRLP